MIRQLQAELAEARNVADVWVGIRSAAARLAWVGGRDGSPDRWDELGISIRVANLDGNSGGRTDIGGTCVIEVASEPYARQRFTVAHEVGHLLLDSCRPAIEAEAVMGERLCDSFAQALLIPPDELARHLAANPVSSAVDAFAIARHFGVSIAVALGALRDSRLLERIVLLAAEWRGHPDRPHVMHYRCGAWAGPADVFVPPHTRLTTLGLQDLALRAAMGHHRDVILGDDEVRLSPGPALRGKHVESLRGSVRWDTLVLGERSKLIAHLDISELAPVVRAGRRRRAEPAAPRDVTA